MAQEKEIKLSFPEAEVEWYYKKEAWICIDTSAQAETGHELLRITKDQENRGYIVIKDRKRINENEITEERYPVTERDIEALELLHHHEKGPNLSRKIHFLKEAIARELLKTSGEVHDYLIPYFDQTGKYNAIFQLGKAFHEILRKKTLAKSRRETVNAAGERILLTQFIKAKDYDPTEMVWNEVKGKINIGEIIGIDGIKDIVLPETLKRAQSIECNYRSNLIALGLESATEIRAHHCHLAELKNVQSIKTLGQIFAPKLKEASEKLECMEIIAPSLEVCHNVSVHENLATEDTPRMDVRLESLKLITGRLTTNCKVFYAPELKQAKDLVIEVADETVTPKLGLAARLNINCEKNQLGNLKHVIGTLDLKKQGPLELENLTECGDFYSDCTSFHGKNLRRAKSLMMEKCTRLGAPELEIVEREINLFVTKKVDLPKLERTKELYVPGALEVILPNVKSLGCLNAPKIERFYAPELVLAQRPYITNTSAEKTMPKIMDWERLMDILNKKDPIEPSIQELAKQFGATQTLAQLMWMQEPKPKIKEAVELLLKLGADPNELATLWIERDHDFGKVKTTPFIVAVTLENDTAAEAMKKRVDMEKQIIIRPASAESKSETLNIKDFMVLCEHESQLLTLHSMKRFSADELAEIKLGVEAKPEPSTIILGDKFQNRTLSFDTAKQPTMARMNFMEHLVEFLIQQKDLLKMRESEKQILEI